MQFRVRILLIVVLLVAAVGTYVIISRPPPELTFTETLLPGCTETHYAITPEQLRVTRNGKTIAAVPTSSDLLRAIHHPSIGALGHRYEEPGMYDGIHVLFHFASGRTTREIQVENRYVTSLGHILDECNRLLPKTAQSHLSDSIFSRRQRLEAMADHLRTNTSIRAEIRDQMVEDLRKAASEVPRPSTTAAGTDSSPSRSRD